MLSQKAVSRSAGDFRTSVAPSPLSLRATASPYRALPAHSVAVTVLVVPLVGVPLAGGHARLPHDDHAGRAPIDAQTASRAHVLVDHEHDVVVGVDARLLGVERLGHRVGTEHVDALPRADVDAALAHDA